MKVIETPIESIKPYENNPRKISAEAIEKVMASIKEFGFQQPIVVDKDMVIIVGHTRLLASQKLGLDKVPVIVADNLTDEQARAYRLADNKTGEFSQWDDKLLSFELQELECLNFDMEPFGFELEEESVEVFEDEFEGEPVEVSVQLGDIYELGEHRLMCGDSTDRECVNALMGGAMADMVITDPPYNVAYEGKTADALRIQNDNMESAQFLDFLTKAFTCLSDSLKAGGAFYIWYASREHINFESALNAVGLVVREQLIWNKNVFCLSRQDYHWKHEPCLYGWKDGAPHYFIDDRTQSTVIDENKPLANAIHPTMKPVELISRLVRNSSRPQETVLDLFGGSGTTLIACEQLNRKCFMMEFDPVYCQVIIDRWEAFTGKKAIKVN